MFVILKLLRRLPERSGVLPRHLMQFVFYVAETQ